MIKVALIHNIRLLQTRTSSVIGNKKTIKYYCYNTVSNHQDMPSFILKALVSDHPLLFYYVVAYDRESPFS